ncbi:TerD family protein [Streptomyces sp. NPDC020807]|uniref:TerD family protein n=1 Tax=Streptomyces sp. NPDC020807 TaxID=3155119 RepID=UPI003409D7FC
MIKGNNGWVPSVPLRIAVRGRGLDAMALLLTERGTVRGDADVVFHGAPAHPAGAVRLTEGDAATGTSWLEVGLPTVEAQIARVLVVGSTERGAMRDVDGLAVEAYAPDGGSVARYEVTDGAGETAMVLAELYRRDGGWKFRAVGQGWASGLAGLATDHGVDVAQEAPAVAPVAAAQTPPPATPYGTGSAPAPSPAPSFAPPPPPVPAPAPEPAPGFGPPPAAPYAPGFAAPPPPAPQSPPGYGPPPGAYAPPTYGPPTSTPPGYGPPGHLPPPPQAAPSFGPPATGPAPGAVPGPFPAQVPWSYGPVFAPHVLTGRHNDVISVPGLPPGPVVVQLEVEGDGYTGLYVLDHRNKEAEDGDLVSSTEEDFRGRMLATVPANGNLRLRLEAEGPWRVEVAPLASALVLTEAEVPHQGPDVLLHTGGTADLVIDYRGDDALFVNLYELRGHHDHTTLPEMEDVVCETGSRRETVPLPAGPLVVQVESADGPWSARLRPL